MKFSQDCLKDLTEFGGGRYSAESLGQAYQFCEKIAKSHYENFPVASVIIPKKHRKHFYSVYAFSRIADDIADEIPQADKEKKIGLLDKLEEGVTNIESQKSPGSKNPILFALGNTMQERGLPKEPFHKLIKAFKMDADFKRPKSIDDLEYYCRHSANPVGELVLRIYGFWGEKTAEYSDSICTGLQLANFWQDFSRDLRDGRIYAPADLLEKYGIEPGGLFEDAHNEFNFCKKFDKLLAELIKLTMAYFETGKSLIPLLPDFRLRWEISAVLSGGIRISRQTEKLRCAVLKRRPHISRLAYINILFSSLFRRGVI